MFIEITWKNTKGDEKKALVPSDKVQNFVNQFLERSVNPTLILPNNDDSHSIPDKEPLTVKQS